MEKKIVLSRKLKAKQVQIQGTLELKEQGHPFVAFLMLAVEEGERLEAETAHRELLPSLPLQASKNLLRRLQGEGYFERKADGQEDNSLEEYLEEDYELDPIELDNGENEYQLSDWGRTNANDNSFWTSAQATFDIYQVQSPFLSHLPLKVDMELNDHGKEEREEHIISKKKRLELEKREFWAFYKGECGECRSATVRFSEIKKKYLSKQDEDWNLTLKFEEGKSLEAKVKPGKGKGFEPPLAVSISYGEALDEILENAEHVNWDKENQIVWTPFNPGRLTFNRPISINKPKLKGRTFQKTQTPPLAHVPATQEDADQWNMALVHAQLKQYYLSEEKFNEMASRQSRRFLPWWTVAPIQREDLIEHLQGKPESFYELAKLTTIDYLNY